MRFVHSRDDMKPSITLLPFLVACMGYAGDEVGTQQPNRNQITGLVARRSLDQVFGDTIYPEERAGDQRQEANAKQQPAFALEVGLPQHAFDRSVAHKQRAITRSLLRILRGSR